MPRGVKKAPKSINEKFEEIDAKIVSFRAKIKDLEEQKKALIETERQETLKTVLSTIEEKGLTLEEAIDAIKKHKK